MKLSNTVQRIRKEIFSKLPVGSVVPQHTDKAHFYRVPSGEVLPSVTGKLGLIKDQSIGNWKMNQSLGYIEDNFHKYFPRIEKSNEDDVFEPRKVLFTPDNLWKMVENAKKKPVGIFEDAGDIGTNIHDRRELYFNNWIKAEERPDITKYYDIDKDDPRLVSGMRALGKFCDDTGYIPIVSELLVYSDEYGTAGTLDDIGLIRTYNNKGKDDCVHKNLVTTETQKFNLPASHCPDCGLDYHYELALCDLKTSNQFKSSYHFQVGTYYMMFTELTGLKPTQNFILKVSKENGTYQIEDLKKIDKIVKGVKHLLEFSEINEMVNKSRKQKNKKTITI